MNKRGVISVIASVALVALVVIIYLFLVKDGEKSLLQNEDKTPRAAPAVSDSFSGIRKVIASEVNKGSKKRKRSGKRFKDGVDRSMFARFSQADKKLAEVVQEALDADDADKAIKAAVELMTSSNPEARSHAVDALGWFGLKAIPELTMLMGDSNEDVAQNAINAWESSFSEIEEAQTRLKVSTMALNALSSKDALVSIGAQFSVAASEYIDEINDKAISQNRRVNVLQSLVDMIGSSNKTLSEVGRDLYEEITGHNWINMDEAELYLRDPDNYEPPEPSDGAASDASM